MPASNDATPPARPSRRRERAFAALALVLGIAVPAIVFEAGLRLFPPAWLEARMHELAVGSPGEVGSDRGWPVETVGQTFHRFVPRSRFTVRHPEYRHEVTIDGWGGRVTPPPARPDPTRPDGLLPFLGDSFTFGLGVGDEETFVARIAPHFRRRLLNLGIAGSSLDNHLDTLALRHRELGAPPFYVFVFFMGNDFADLSTRYERPAPRSGGRVRSALWHANLAVLRNPLLEGLYSVQLLRQRILATLNRAGASAMQPVFLAMRTDLPHLDRALGHLERELDRLEALAGALAFRYAFVVVPDVYQLDPRRRAWKARSYGLEPSRLAPGRIGERLRAVLEARAVPFVDLAPCLDGPEVGRMYYIHDTHFTAAGHARAAECILESDLQRWAAATAGAGAVTADRRSPS